jgi:hypothetical protein
LPGRGVKRLKKANRDEATKASRLPKVKNELPKKTFPIQIPVKIITQNQINVKKKLSIFRIEGAFPLALIGREASLAPHMRAVGRSRPPRRL